MEGLTVSAAEAVAQFIEHVRTQDQSRQRARSQRDETYKPSEGEKIERQRLMSQMLVTLEVTRNEMIGKLAIDKATWDRWRSMVTLPQRNHLEALMRMARVEAADEHGSNPLIAQSTDAMLQAVDITRKQLEELAWLIKLQQASGEVSLSKAVCTALLEDYRTTKEVQ